MSVNNLPLQVHLPLLGHCKLGNSFRVDLASLKPGLSKLFCVGDTLFKLKYIATHFNHNLNTF